MMVPYLVWGLKGEMYYCCCRSVLLVVGGWYEGEGVEVLNDNCSAVEFVWKRAFRCSRFINFYRFCYSRK